MRIEVEVRDVECICNVTHYLPEVPAVMTGHPDNWMPAEAAQIEYELFDEDGNRLVSLEREMSPEDESELFGVIIDEYSRCDY